MQLKVHVSLESVDIMYSNGSYTIWISVSQKALVYIFTTLGCFHEMSGMCLHNWIHNLFC